MVADGFELSTKAGAKVWLRLFSGEIEAEIKSAGTSNGRVREHRHKWDQGVVNKTRDTVI